LKFWRAARRLSQLALATEAEVSARHLCFVETGRARPSRELILLLAHVLDVPLRERNQLLLAAGFAPMFKETALEASELAHVRAALDAILRQQEPFPAVVMNRGWEIVRSNTAASRFFGYLLGDTTPAPTANVMHMMFDPRLVRPFVTNWPEVAGALLRRIQREAVGRVDDEGTARLLRELLTFPDAQDIWHRSPPTSPVEPVLPVSFAKDGRRFEMFSAVTTLGTPQDITLQEIRIECFFPANPATEHELRELATAKQAAPS
jgi:transcriptional regulator with XRE-family HTH domain